MRAKLSICFLLCALLFSCRDKNRLSAPAAIEYQLVGNQYAIVVIQEGISQQEARDVALRKAAALTVKHEYRYFTIKSEDEVSVLKSSKSASASRPSNLYYELIQEQDFGREPPHLEGNDPSQLVQGYRLVIDCFKEKPAGSSVDALQ